MGEATPSSSSSPSPSIPIPPLNHKFIIDPSESLSMARSQGLSSPADLLPSLVHRSRHLARPPISSFSVCAAALAADNSIFLGVNLEFPGLPLHHSVHAEQFLLTTLALQRHPRPPLLNVVVSAFPCGHCRQFLQEIRSAPEIQILVPPQESNSDTDSDFQSLSYLLPNRFGPDDLLDKDVPLILETHDNRLILDDEVGEKRGLAMAALEAANGSHAPYSKCPSGVALVDVEGRVYKGSYLESAAYNPSMGPAQTAVVAFVAAAGGGYERIAAAALAEKEGAVVRQEETVRLFLKVVAPNCEFHVFRCKASCDSSSSVSGSEKV